MILCYKVFSILVFTCLMIAFATSLMGAMTHSWWVGDFEAYGIIDNVSSSMPKGYQVHLLFTAKFGLTKFCWRMEQALEDGYQREYPLFNKTKKCFSEAPDGNPSPQDAMENDMKYFSHILICLIIAIISICIAFCFSFFTLPCLRVGRKRIYVFIRFLFTLLAAITNLVAIIIAQLNLTYNARFMKRKPPIETNNLSSIAESFLNGVFQKYLITNLDEEFEKGYSFYLACVAELFVLLAFVFTIVEHCCARGSGDREYKSKLIREDRYDISRNGGI